MTGEAGTVTTFPRMLTTCCTENLRARQSTLSALTKVAYRMTVPVAAALRVRPQSRETVSFDGFHSGQFGLPDTTRWARLR